MFYSGEFIQCRVIIYSVPYALVFDVVKMILLVNMHLVFCRVPSVAEYYGISNKNKIPHRKKTLH